MLGRRQALELKDFIKLALTEICDGIAEARTDIESKYQGNCIIAPATIHGVQAYEGTNDISFDLAIELEEANSSAAECKIGLKVLNIGMGSGNKISEKKINRITFSVPFIPQGLRKAQDKI